LHLGVCGRVRRGDGQRRGPRDGRALRAGRRGAGHRGRGGAGQRGPVPGAAGHGADRRFPGRVPASAAVPTADGRVPGRLPATAAARRGAGAAPAVATV
ncbi:MAG: hypothetical protein AVDCRST_MAG64-2444, partial [uncultured Phycisphaerae bacterium]